MHRLELERVQNGKGASMSDIEIHHLGAAYALDALDERERLAFEAHYSACEICRTDVREFRAAAADLAGLTASPPPPELRAKVLTEVGATRQLSPLHASVARLADHRRSRTLTATMAVAAAVACFVVGAVAVGGFGRGESFDDTVAAIMVEPGARVAQLAGDGDGSIRIAWSGDRAAVIGDDLPEPPAGSVYELWLIDDGGAQPMRLLDAAADGSVRRVVDVSGRPAAWGVTIEPAEGSTAPTLPILYQAEVPPTA